MERTLHLVVRTSSFHLAFYTTPFKDEHPLILLFLDKQKQIQEVILDTHHLSTRHKRNTFPTNTLRKIEKEYLSKRKTFIYIYRSEPSLGNQVNSRDN